MRTPVVVAAAAGFVVGVLGRGPWPALPPSDTFWWAAWAAPLGALLFAALAYSPIRAEPRRALWPHGVLALLLGYGVTVNASVVLGMLASLWGAAVLGAALAHVGTPATRAFGSITTSLVVTLALAYFARRYAALPVGPLVLYVLSFAAAAVPVPKRAHVATLVLAAVLAVGAAWWCHAASEVLELY